MKGLVRQGPGPFTLKQVASPGDLAPPRERSKVYAGLYSTTGHDDTCQEAL
jgi:hypothetical protein